MRRGEAGRGNTLIYEGNVESRDYSTEMLKLVEKGNRKCWVYKHLLKKLLKRLGVLIETPLNPCVLRG